MCDNRYACVRERELAQQLQAAAAAAHITVGSDGHVRSGVSHGEADEDEARRYWLLALEQAVLQATARTAALQQEAALLRHRATMAPGQTPPPTQPPAELLQQLHAAADSLQGIIGMQRCAFCHCESSGVTRVHTQGSSGSAWLQASFGPPMPYQP